MSFTVVRKEAPVAATIQENKAVSDRFKGCLNIMFDSESHR
jgi:hypothetical protein